MVPQHCVARLVLRWQLRLLCDLDEHILNYIGLTRSQLTFEAYKAFRR
jgi:uncharacterized protein YjiS (DUF1127 family)